MSDDDEPRESDANRLARAAYRRGEAATWFEPLYREAAAGRAVVPWDRGTPNVHLVAWAAERDPAGRTALVVGCGLGRDSEYLAGLGWHTTAFDLSETAVRGARERHPGTTVRYETADLLRLPDRYHHAFDLVVESYTVQSLPDPPRNAAIQAVSATVAAGGTLLVIAAAGDAPATEGPPFPLTRAEIDAFAVDGIEPRTIDHDVDADGVARWIAEFGRARD